MSAIYIDHNWAVNIAATSSVLAWTRIHSIRPFYRPQYTTTFIHVYNNTLIWWVGYNKVKKSLSYDLIESVTTKIRLPRRRDNHLECGIDHISNGNQSVLVSGLSCQYADINGQQILTSLSTLSRATPVHIWRDRFHLMFENIKQYYYEGKDVRDNEHDMKGKCIKRRKTPKSDHIVNIDYPLITRVSVFFTISVIVARPNTKEWIVQSQGK